MTENETPIRAGRRTPAGRALALMTAAAIATAGFGPAVTPAHAQGSRSLPVIRDTEIENLLRDYASPILKVAGLARNNVKVVIINSRSFNAFVMDGRHIFVNAGALFDSKTPNELIGVIAHETGHLADGHLMRLRERLARAQTLSIISMIAGIGAAVAGAKAGVSGSGNIGAAAILAPQSAIRNSMLAYVRTQEDQADHAAMKFLNATHQSGRGMVDLFKRLSNDILFVSRSIDPYMQNHPMPADRVAALESMAKASPYWNKKDPPALQLRHDLMRAKLSGFLERPDTVLRRYPPSNHSLAARYARAISAYRNSRPATRHRHDRRPHPQRTEQSLFQRAQGPGAAGRRPAGAGDRAVAPRGGAVAPRPADLDHAGPGHDRHQQQEIRARGGAAVAGGGAPRAGTARRL